MHRSSEIIKVLNISGVVEKPSRVLPRLRAKWLVYVAIDFPRAVRCFLCHWVSLAGNFAATTS